MTVEQSPELEELIEEIVFKVLSNDHSIIAYPEWIRRAIAQSVHRGRGHGPFPLNPDIDKEWGDECPCACHDLMSWG